MQYKILNIQNKYTPYIAWFIAASFVFLQFFLQTSSSLMNDLWMKDFHINTIQVSNLSAAFFYTYVLMQIPVGILYDRYSAKKLLIFAASTLFLGCLLLSVTHEYKLAFIARFFMGIGASFGYIGMLKVILNNFTSDKFVLMLGISELLSVAIITLAIILLGYILQYFSWHFAMFINAIFSGALIFLILFFMQNDTKEIEPVNFFDIFNQLKTILLNKQIILCSMCSFFLFSIINAFTSLWGINFITHTTMYSPQTAANMISVVFIGLGIGAPLNGILTKKFKNSIKILTLHSIAISLTTFIIILIPGLSKNTFYILLFLSGIFCSGYLQCISIIKDLVDPKIHATALATANMIIMTGAPILQLLIGSLLNINLFNLSISANYHFSLAVIPLGMVIAVLLSLAIHKANKHVIIKNI